MKIYVVISECGLNEHVLHYAGLEQPSKKRMQAWANEVGHYTGYTSTTLYQAEGAVILDLSWTVPNRKG